MHGGVREGAGRKGLENKKQAVSVYINSTEREIIEKLSLVNCKTLSSRLRELIKKGIDSIDRAGENKANTIKYIDLFCGLGGIRIGFEEALSEFGFVGKCVFSSDVKAHAIKAYKENFGEDSRCDITKIDSKDLPNFDFLLAGFPCQAFSLLLHVTLDNFATVFRTDLKKALF